MFYASHDIQEGAYFIFFTSGLLMYVVQFLEFVPQDIQFVLIGCNLTNDEVIVLRSQYIYPMFFFQQKGTTDQDVLDMLLECNTNNFGYCDVDTLLLNPKILYNAMCLSDDTVINCYRTYKVFGNIDICETNFMYFNIKECRKIGLSVKSYTYEQTTNIVPSECFSELAEIAPLGLYPLQNCFDTLILFQLICKARLKKITCIQDKQLLEEDDLNFAHFGRCMLISLLYSHQNRQDKTDYSLHDIKTILFAQKLICKFRSRLPASYLTFANELETYLQRCQFADIVPKLKNKLSIRRIHPLILNLIFNEF